MNCVVTQQWVTADAKGILYFFKQFCGMFEATGNIDGEDYNSLASV